MLKVMELKFNRMEVLMVIMFYLFISLALIFGANRFDRIGLNFINNNMVENITR